jgi:hypothetical protein
MVPQVLIRAYEKVMGSEATVEEVRKFASDLIRITGVAEEKANDPYAHLPTINFMFGRSGGFTAEVVQPVDTIEPSTDEFKDLPVVDAGVFAKESNHEVPDQADQGRDDVQAPADDTPGGPGRAGPVPQGRTPRARARSGGSRGAGAQAGAPSSDGVREGLVLEPIPGPPEPRDPMPVPPAKTPAKLPDQPVDLPPLHPPTKTALDGLADLDTLMGL